MTELLIVVGSERDSIKAAALVQAAVNRDVPFRLLDAGARLSEATPAARAHFGLPPADIDLGTGEGAGAKEIGRVMVGFESVLRRVAPSIVLLVGSNDATLACSLVAVKEGFPSALVEAGVRSKQPGEPDELTRKVCDHLSSYLFVSGREQIGNLRREGVGEAGLLHVGNTLSDVLLPLRDRLRASDTATFSQVEPGRYVVVRLGEAENVEEYNALAGLVEAVLIVARCAPVVFLLHPATEQALARFGLDEALRAESNVRLHGPSAHLERLGLCARAGLVVTDSGQMEEETTVLGVPCITVRGWTEHRATVLEGTNVVVGNNPERIVEEALTVLEGPARPARRPELWDGSAAARILTALDAASDERRQTVSAIA